MYGLKFIFCVSPFDILHKREGTKRSLCSRRRVTSPVESSVNSTWRPEFAELSCLLWEISLFLPRNTIARLPGSEERGRNSSCSASSFSQGKVAGNTAFLDILIRRGQGVKGSSLYGFQSSNWPTREPSKPVVLFIRRVCVALQAITILGSEGD